MFGRRLDGETWTPLGNADWTARGYHQAVSHNGKIYVTGGGISSTEQVNDVWSSADGENWEQENRKRRMGTASTSSNIVVQRATICAGWFKICCTISLYGCMVDRRTVGPGQWPVLWIGTQPTPGQTMASLGMGRWCTRARCMYWVGLGAVVASDRYNRCMVIDRRQCLESNNGFCTMV